MTRVIGVAGPIGAGKSVVADYLAVAYGGSRRSFGGEVRRRAHGMNAPTHRESLQELGDSIIASEGWESFCREVLAGSVDRYLVVDGIRHVGAVEGLTAIVGERNVRLVFVDAPRQQRLARLAIRDGTTRSQLDLAEAHRNESEVPLVRRRADVIIDNQSGTDVDQTGRKVVLALEALGFDRPLP